MSAFVPALVPLDGPSRRPRALMARRILICGVYLVFSAVTLMMAHGGVLALVTGEAPAGAAFGSGAVTGMKLLGFCGFLVTAGTAGRSVVAVQWILVGVATWLVTDLLAPQNPTAGDATLLIQYGALSVVYVGPWLLLSPERRELFHLRARPDRLAVVAAVVALPFLIGWTWQMAHLPSDTAESGFDAVAIPLTWASASLFAAVRPSGRRWPLVAVACFSVYLGVVALATPTSDRGSPGSLGGAALLALAGIFMWRARQRPATSPRRSRRMRAVSAPRRTQ